MRKLYKTMAVVVLMIVLLFCIGCAKEDEEPEENPYTYENTAEMNLPSGETVQVQTTDGYAVCMVNDAFIFQKDGVADDLYITIVDEKGRQGSVREAKDFYNIDVEEDDNGGFMYETDVSATKVYPLEGTSYFVVATYPLDNDGLSHISVKVK